MMPILKECELFKGHKLAHEALGEMELMFNYIDALGFIENVRFDFSMARGLDYYTGIIYEAVMLGEKNIGSIAGGGRYDELVGMFGSKIPSVGASIGIERIFSLLEEKEKESNEMRASSTQILIAQAGKNLIKERLLVCKELRNAGIRTETLYFDNPKP